MGLSKINLEEYSLLTNQEILRGCDKSSPIVQRNKELVKKLLSKGLLQRDLGPAEYIGWCEESYEISSQGRLEINLFVKDHCDDANF